MGFQRYVEGDGMAVLSHSKTESPDFPCKNRELLSYGQADGLARRHARVLPRIQESERTAYRIDQDASQAGLEGGA